MTNLYYKAVLDGELIAVINAKGQDGRISASGLFTRCRANLSAMFQDVSFDEMQRILEKTQITSIKRPEYETLALIGNVEKWE